MDHLDVESSSNHSSREKDTDSARSKKSEKSEEFLYNIYYKGDEINQTLTLQQDDKFTDIFKEKQGSRQERLNKYNI